MDWISNHAWETWLIVAVALAALELVSLDLILVMLAGGALLGAVVALFGAAFAVQVLVALAASVGLLALVRPNVVRRLHNGPHLRTGTEALIGRQALVLREMSAHHPGRVKIGGEEWSAAPYSEDEVIPEGEIVDVVQIKGATAYVLRVQQLPFDS
jgi:membrane protein implicated in regulation of membrane protease activity